MASGNTLERVSEKCPCPCAEVVVIPGRLLQLSVCGRKGATKWGGEGSLGWSVCLCR